MVDISVEGLKALVVDDEKSVRDLVARVLGSMGMRTGEAADGLEALEKLEQGGCDIVLADIKMPRMDGMILLGRIREDHPGVDVVIMTSYAADYTYADVVTAGAIDFIAKPFSVEEIKAKIKRVARERRLTRELMEANSRLEAAYAEILAMRDDEETRCRQINYERERLIAESEKMRERLNSLERG